MAEKMLPHLYVLNFNLVDHTQLAATFVEL